MQSSWNSPAWRFLLMLFCTGVVRPLHAQTILVPRDSTLLPQASLWGTISLNPATMTVVTIQPVSGRPHLFLRTLDTAFVQQGQLVQITFDSDPPAGKYITDHKHLFLGGAYFVAFSVSGDSDLFLLKLGINGQRIGPPVTVVAGTADRTNDMFLTTDGIVLHVGYYRPPVQTVFHTFRQDLGRAGPPVVTSTSLPHNNIGSAVFKDGRFFMFTGDLFGRGARLILTRWNSDWTPAASSPQTLIPSANGDGNWFATGAAYDVLNRRWYVGFHHILASDPEGGEHIDIAAFDTSFVLLERYHATGPQKYRPHFLLYSQRLYMTYDRPGSVFLRKYEVQAAAASPVPWRQYFTLDPAEGVQFAAESIAVVAGGSVPGLNIAGDDRVVLGWGTTRGAGRRAGVSPDTGRTFHELTNVIQPNHVDGGFVYLPNGWLRFLSEEPLPDRPPQPHKSRIISSVSSDGLNWAREAGIRYQPGAPDDSICSVPAVLQVRDSAWRMYYVGDWYRTNGTRTALSTDWGWTWTAESGVNVLRNHDVDPHPVYLTDGRVRLYHRHMRDPGGIALTDGDGLRFDTTLTRMLVPDGSGLTDLKLDPAVIRYPNGRIACYIGAVPFQPGGHQVKVIAAWSEPTTWVGSLPPPYCSEIVLLPSYPNPFNAATTFRFSVGGALPYALRVYNILGEKVATVAEGCGSLRAGSASWDAGGMPSGVYLVQLESGNEVRRGRVIILK